MTSRAGPRLDLLTAITAATGQPVTMEAAPLDERRVVSITGGTFAGPRHVTDSATLIQVIRS